MNISEAMEIVKINKKNDRFGVCHEFYEAQSFIDAWDQQQKRVDILREALEKLIKWEFDVNELPVPLNTVEYLRHLTILMRSAKDSLDSYRNSEKGDK